MSDPASLRRYPGAERIKSLDSLELSGKRVFLRVDFNVPLQNGKVADDTRIKAALPTIEYLCEKGAAVICASHFGRPKGKRDPKFSLEPAASRLGELCNRDIIFSEDCKGNGVTRQTKELKPGQILVLENLRFYEGEEANSEEFCHDLAKLCDVYVNDAFGTCHRAHASTAGLPLLVPHRAAGLLLEKEISSLSTLIYNPLRPLVSIIGGAKVSDKAKVVDALMVKSSKIIIGGAMAYTFLKALNVQTGNSRVEPDLVPLAKKLLDRSEQAQCKILLPVDHVTGESFDKPGTPKITENAHIPEGAMGLDIGPKTRELFTRELQGAQSVFWNGPMGVFEKPPFHEGTFAIAKAIAELDAKEKICGGGDSVSAINQSGLASGFTHISTGGGASLEMIEGKAMPGIEALKLSR
ncbi:phosphoglycerate kinase [bacterium]|nr:phosphoglycerate kinase [bacterium]